MEVTVDHRPGAAMRLCTGSLTAVCTARAWSGPATKHMQSSMNLLWRLCGLTERQLMGRLDAVLQQAAGAT